jgi:UDP-glucuronate decarboxylase
VNAVGPRACYDEGKRCAETLCFDHYRRHRILVKVVRIFNTYGPRMHPDDGRVIANFVVQALKNEPITIFGDGSQTRSFCFVDDLVDGIMRMLAGPAEMVGPMNLGNPAELPIAELADLVLALTGSKSKIVRKPLPTDDPKRRRPDISLARQSLGWTPKVPLRDGLMQVIEYFEEILTEKARPQAQTVMTTDVFPKRMRSL